MIERWPSLKCQLLRKQLKLLWVCTTIRWQRAYTCVFLSQDPPSNKQPHHFLLLNQRTASDCPGDTLSILRVFLKGGSKLIKLVKLLTDPHLKKSIRQSIRSIVISSSFFFFSLLSFVLLFPASFSELFNTETTIRNKRNLCLVNMSPIHATSPFYIQQIENYFPEILHL